MHTKRWMICAAVLSMGWLAVAVRSGLSEDTPKPKGESAAAAPERRLPYSYGQIGLSDEQKQAVYKIQDKYRPQMEELEKKLMELRAKQTAEIDLLLTDGQQLRLKEIRQQFEERRRNALNRRRGGETGGRSGTSNGEGNPSTPTAKEKN